MDDSPSRRNKSQIKENLLESNKIIDENSIPRSLSVAVSAKKSTNAQVFQLINRFYLIQLNVALDLVF